jgi:group I intron endonuclease
VYYEKPIIGIYKITHKPTGRAYIGLSVDIFKRFKEHTNFAQAKKKWQAIKKAIHEHGITEFTFEVIEVCPEEHLAEREVYWISFYDTCSENGFNKNRGKVKKVDDDIYDVWGNI